MTRSAPPSHSKSQFWTVFAEWLRFGGIFRGSVRAKTKKRSSTFLAKESAPPDKILATPMFSLQPDSFLMALQAVAVLEENIWGVKPKS